MIPTQSTAARELSVIPDFSFSAGVALFGMILRDSSFRGHGTIAEVARRRDRASCLGSGVRRWEPDTPDGRISIIAAR